MDALPLDTSYNISLLPTSLGPSPITSDTQFLPSSWPIATKVFEAKRDFGAVGDGKAQDRASIQNCIDAAAARIDAEAGKHWAPGRRGLVEHLLLVEHGYAVVAAQQLLSASEAGEEAAAQCGINAMSCGNPAAQREKNCPAVVRKGERLPWLAWVLAEVFHDQVAVRKHHDAIAKIESLLQWCCLCPDSEARLLKIRPGSPS